ncbi:MAG: SMI1/KNR4 family protein [Blautia sp.]|nr:SMI1/KNR4 family protein [Blautia sp.]
MISDELKEIIDLLKSQGKMHFIEAADDEHIVKFEADNDIQFPSKYKEWLRFSDGGEFFLPAGVQLYGVAHKPLINVEDDDRPDDSYIVIGALASGDPVLCQKNGEKIFVYDHEAGEIDEELIYEDFFAFLKDLYDLLGIGE